MQTHTHTQTHSFIFSLPLFPSLSLFLPPSFYPSLPLCLYFNSQDKYKRSYITEGSNMNPSRFMASTLMSTISQMGFFHWCVSSLAFSIPSWILRYWGQTLDFTSLWIMPHLPHLQGFAKGHFSINYSWLPFNSNVPIHEISLFFRVIHISEIYSSSQEE